MEQNVDFLNHTFETHPRVTDRDFIYIIKDLISEAIINNRVYYDYDDIEIAIEVIYPIVSMIIFNSTFNLRYDAKGIDDLITYLVVNLA